MKIRAACVFVGIVLFVSTSCARRSASPVCHGGAYLTSSKFCRAQKAPVHQLPFPEGYQTRVNQGFHGLISHNGNSSYAVDFECEFGDLVSATRHGVVVSVKEDSDQGCAERRCAPSANYIVIDHGDGTRSAYSHLAHLGVLVEVGDQVCKGTTIGLCGSTGFSTAPHLHFEVSDLSRRTIPVQFREARRQTNFSFVIPETTYRSENKKTLSCGSTHVSALRRDAFAHQGVMISDKIETTGKLGETWRIEGRYFGDAPKIAVMAKTKGADNWVNLCVDVDDGRFNANLKWTSSTFSSGENWLMITGADDKCRGTKFDWSYHVWIQ